MPDLFGKKCKILKVSWNLTGAKYKAQSFFLFFQRLYEGQGQAPIDNFWCDAFGVLFIFFGVIISGAYIHYSPNVEVN